MSEYRLLIDGELVAGSGTMDVINPANETVLAQCPLADVGQLEQAVAAANRAFPAWSQTPIAERKQKLLQVADAIKANAERVTKVLTGEQGKPLEQAAAEVGFAEIFCRHFAAQDLPSEVLLEDENQRVEIHRKPLGVVAGIMPWNFPFLIAVYKLAPALLAGNTLILKPAPTTPLTALMLGAMIKDILPPGVLNIIADNNDLGAALTKHPKIAKISFTGSTPTGKAIMASAAGTLKRLTLELGGNDAAIVLDDADPKKIAAGIFGSAFLNSGQVCIALKRLYVHESIYDSLCDEIAAMANSAVVGDGMEAGTQFGPVQNKAQFDKVCHYVESAKQTGKIIAGGDIPNRPGYFVPLTVVRDIEDGTPLVDEEPFGPVLPIIKYTDLEDVIARANSSPYGLGGSVWSSNMERAQQVASRIDSGTVWVNQHCAFGPHIPFPPAKESGVGVEWGKEGLEEFTAMQVININKAG
ncbi:MAG: aldehyde dehydrogenase family protein [Pseudomonadales bacterium]|nr:aldehyde dehydrogenase family protein [Pseudomonadales bacterium]MCP5215024.1 aldehyde dehydrogenase family protein [Pseudomonadales bacterium]